MKDWIGCAAMAAGGVIAWPALADVSAEDVWANTMAPFEALNAEIEAEPVREGNRLVIDDFSIRFSFAQGRGRLLVSSNGLVLEENGDGTVSVLYPEEATDTARLEFTGEDGGVEALVVTRRMDGTAVERTARGVPGDITHEFATDGFTHAIALRMPEETGGADLRVTVEVRDGAGTYRVTEGEGVTISGRTDYAELITRSETTSSFERVEGVSVTQSQRSEQRLTGFGTGYEAVLPARPLSLMDLSQGLRDGLAFGGTTRIEGSTVETEVSVDGEEMGTQTYEVGPQEAALRLDAEGLSLEGRFEEMAFAMASRMVPVPLMIGLSGADYGLQMPLNRTESPEDAVMELSLRGIELGEGIWSMLDPEGALPREAAALGFEAEASIELLADLLDFPALAALMEAGGEAPVLLHGLRVHDLVVEAAGARLTGDADLTFDNGDYETFDGMPAPDGVIELVLNGGNALIDRLEAARLLPADQAAGARMMLGVFAVKGEGEDRLTSTIEVQKSGEVTANGQRIR